MVVEAGPAPAVVLDPHRTSCWCSQVAASPTEGCSGGVHVEEVLHHARGELSPQQDPAGGLFPENREYLHSWAAATTAPQLFPLQIYLPWPRQAGQDYTGCPSVCLPGRALVWWNQGTSICFFSSLGRPILRQRALKFGADGWPTESWEDAGSECILSVSKPHPLPSSPISLLGIFWVL